MIIKHKKVFDPKEQAENVIQWIKDWFDKNGKNSPAVVGISGGKDSSVVAALCVKALGKDRVIGVMLPDGDQKDIDYSEGIIKFLEIRRLCFNISDAKKEFIRQLHTAKNSFISFYLDNDKISVEEETERARTNLPARVRMVMLYFVSQSFGGRVANTCNLSEDYVGYSTRYGDAAGDFAPLKSFTTEEVIAIGREIGIPERYLVKPPSDGLCGKTDEDNLGFTYAILNKYIRTGEIEDEETKKKIDRLHRINEFKEKVIDRYIYEP